MCLLKEYSLVLKKVLFVFWRRCSVQFLENTPLASSACALMAKSPDIFQENAPSSVARIAKHLVICCDPSACGCS